MAARPPLALGHLGPEEHWLQSDRHGLQLPESPPLTADLAALASRTDQRFRLDQQQEAKAALAVLRPPVLVAFPHTKRMGEQALIHGPENWATPPPDSNFPDEPFYRLAPRRPTRFAEVWAAALCATVLLRAGESLFVIYLKNFATLNAVYGAFGGFMALLLWIYLSGCVFIFGACLCASQAEAPGQPGGNHHGANG